MNSSMILRIVLIMSVNSTLAKANFLRASTSIPDKISCQNDMKNIDNNANLSTVLQESMEGFNNDFDKNAKEYCTKKEHNGRTFVNCEVGYEKFSSEYEQSCKAANANYHPVTMFVQCAYDSIDLEMDIIGTPSCIARSCGYDENLAMNRALIVVGNQVSGPSCVVIEKALTSQIDMNSLGGNEISENPPKTLGFEITTGISMLLVLALVVIRKRQSGLK